MSITFNSAGGTTYATHDTLAATLAGVDGNCSFAVWINGASTGDYWMSLGSSAANDAAFFILYTSPSAFHRARRGGFDVTTTENLTGITGDWRLHCMNFRTDTDTGVSMSHSVNGANFAIPALSSGGTSNPNQLTIGAGRFNGTSAFSHVLNMSFAYPAAWSGHLTNAHAAAMYGDGPTVGNGLAPWLVNTENLLHASSWFDGTVTQGTGTVGTAWTIVGANTSKGDNPTLIESSGTGNRRNRRRYGPTARV